MTIDVKAGSFTASAVQSSGSLRVKSTGGGSASVRVDSTQALVKISASSKLSGVEKTGLIKDVAIVDRFASDNNNLRKTLLNDVIRTTTALERFAPPNRSEPVQAVEQTARQFVEARRQAESLDTNRLQEQVQRDIQTRSAQVAAVSQNNALTEVSVAEVERTIQQTPPESVARLQRAVEAISRESSAPQQAPSSLSVTDSVVLSASAENRTVPATSNAAIPENEITFNIPGARIESDLARVRSADFESLPIPGVNRPEVADVSLPGESSESVEFVVPGSGGVPFDAVPLPGASGGVDDLVLPGSAGDGSVEIPLPGQGGGAEAVADIAIPLDISTVETFVTETAALIGESTDIAEAAVAEVELPGRVLSGVEAEEQQAALRRVLQSL